MRRFRFILIAVVALALAGQAGAAGPMTLTHDGDLYSAVAHPTHVVVTARLSGGVVKQLIVPQSMAAAADSLQVDVDEASGALYVFWQTGSGMHASLHIAGYIDGTWTGPLAVAGNDGTSALNPQMLIHRATSVVSDGPDDNGEPTFTTLSTSFLHLGWWHRSWEDDKGTAQYVAIALEADGSISSTEIRPTSLAGLLPYGAACFDIESSDNLNHPKLFVDPQSAKPHIFLTDYEECAFQIMELRPIVVEEIDTTTNEKRRRQIIILRHGSSIAVRGRLPLSRAKLEVGTNLSVVMHWDEGDDRLDYIHLDREGTSEIKSLALDELLTHERAVELIRDLTK